MEAGSGRRGAQGQWASGGGLRASGLQEGGSGPVASGPMGSLLTASGLQKGGGLMASGQWAVGSGQSAQGSQGLQDEVVGCGWVAVRDSGGSRRAMGLVWPSRRSQTRVPGLALSRPYHCTSASSEHEGLRKQPSLKDLQEHTTTLFPLCYAAVPLDQNTVGSDHWGRDPDSTSMHQSWAEGGADRRPPEESCLLCL
ncbi:hypothetical protein EYF80_063529 [Liparis tanakae]|uniref:Uncharacterized protein n=1 Tax=Liparis tanakae TaxID=230148 RepID=A0A4Z2EC84_9TELE|nr:hypothetical protein EYF80_063529 [Liparis tanakae]